jgi:hypothetical protein
VQSAPIKPLIAQLDLITDKTHWGAAFRFGQIKISEADFRRIAEAMGYGEVPASVSPSLSGVAKRKLPVQSTLF